MTVTSAAQEITAACKLVHPNVTHHPCSDCSGTITVLRAAQNMNGGGRMTVTPAPSNGTPCPRCNGTGVLCPGTAEAIADECWAARRPNNFIGAIKDFRARTDCAFSLREAKDYIEAARERKP